VPNTQRLAVPVEMVDEKEHRRRLANQANAAIPVLRDFTPVLQFGGSSTGITYSVQEGRAVTWAEIVHEIWLVITLTSKGSATGNATIAGLVESNGSGIVVCSADITIVAASGNHSDMKAEIEAGSNVVNLYRDHGGFSSSPTPITDANFTNSTELHLHMSFRVV
jgi:hypothetical protein